MKKTKSAKKKKNESELRDGDRIDYGQLGWFGFGPVNGGRLVLNLGCGFFLSAFDCAPWDIATMDDGYGLYFLNIPTPQTYGELRNLLRVLGVESKA